MARLLHTCGKEAFGRLIDSNGNDVPCAACGQVQTPTLGDFYASGEAGFHWRDGWFFKRQADGSIQVRLFDGSRLDSVLLHTINIPEGVWASICTTMSVGGETGESWRMFRAWHNGTGDLK